jgi:tetratricopeptide (TPR) repeat protein
MLWRFWSFLLWAATFVLQNSYSFITKLPWAAAILVIAAILFRGLTEYVTVIEPISVPKTLSETGYTPEVAARRLRDAMVTFTSSVGTRMQHPEIALNSELPNVVVPSVGISLDAVMASIRSLFRITRTQAVAGEITSVNNQLWLRLRLNGREFYSSTKGSDPERPDDVFQMAASAVLRRVKPYFVAVSLHRSNPEEALELTNWIVSQLPEHDENVGWAYVLKGNLLKERGAVLDDPRDIVAAERAYRKADTLGGKWEYAGRLTLRATAHFDLGNLLRDRGDLKGASNEYREAIRLDPTYLSPRNSLAHVLRLQGDNPGAVTLYREVLRLDPKYNMAQTNLTFAMKAAGRIGEVLQETRKAAAEDPKNYNARYNLGLALENAGNIDEAINEYRETLILNPKFFLGYFRLAYASRLLGKNDEAILGYQEALKIDSKDQYVHNNLGFVLYKVGRIDEAISEYRAALLLDPRFVMARNNLGIALSAAGRGSEASLEFRKVLEVEPKNEIARNQLDVILSDQSAIARN